MLITFDINKKTSFPSISIRWTKLQSEINKNMQIFIVWLNSDSIDFDFVHEENLFAWGNFLLVLEKIIHLINKQQQQQQQQ